MKEPVLEHMQSLGAPEWFCRRFFPHMFRGDVIPPGVLKEDREIEPGNLPQARLKRRKAQDRPRRKRRVRVERYQLSPLEFEQLVIAEAQFAVRAHLVHKLAEMDAVKCKFVMARLQELTKKGAK